jgi:hypothetical protein
LTAARAVAISPDDDDDLHAKSAAPPPRPFGAGERSLIVTRAAEGRAAHPQIPALILVAKTAKD